jgi:hypothetical protein
VYRTLRHAGRFNHVHATIFSTFRNHGSDVQNCSDIQYLPKKHGFEWKGSYGKQLNGISDF